MYMQYYTMRNVNGDPLNLLNLKLFPILALSPQHKKSAAQKQSHTDDQPAQSTAKQCLCCRGAHKHTGLDSLHIIFSMVQKGVVKSQKVLKEGLVLLPVVSCRPSPICNNPITCHSCFRQKENRKITLVLKQACPRALKDRNTVTYLKKKVTMFERICEVSI